MNHDIPMHQKLKQPFYSLGNKLIDYFAKLGIAFASGSHFVYQSPYYIQHKEEKDAIFLLGKLPEKIEINDEIRRHFQYISLPRVLGEGYVFVGDFANLWELTSNDRYHFWKCVRPFANNLIHTFLPSCGISNKLGAYPIIHFRCSDVPFSRHGFYHFQRYSFFIDSLNELASKCVDVSKVYIMYSFSHESRERDVIASKTYLSALKTHLEKHNYSVELVSQDPASDFVSLFYAPAVISTCSSFSFVAGFFGNGIFITEGHYNEDAGGTITCSPCYAPFVKKGYSLNHCRVPDYYDTEKVIHHLMS
ncbi:MAG: hypothetical protein EBU93_04900 [Chlamydiae bacterium]|nr:hypothetical protein [Chlamydiota bacterium]